MKKLLALCAALLLSPVAYPQVPGTAVLTWAAVSTFNDGKPITTPVTYNVYSYLKSDPTKTYLVRQTDQLTTTRTGINQGEWCWFVRAVTGGIEGDPSPSGCKVIGTIVPASTTPAASEQFTVS